MKGGCYTFLLLMGFLCPAFVALSEEVMSCPAAARSDFEMKNVYQLHSKETYSSAGNNGPIHSNSAGNNGPIYSSSAGNNGPIRSSFRMDDRFKGVYTFPVDKVPRMNCSDEKAVERIANGLPVILERCTFASSTLKWDIQYLVENLRDEGHGMKISPSRQFLYYSNDLLTRDYKNWIPPTETRYVYFHEFVDIVNELKEANNGSRAYFMSVLYMDEEGLSSNFTDDVNTMDYQWLMDLVTKFRWGMEVTNMLIVGMPDVVTPAHIDILENLFLQISGYKRCILFSPEYFHSLYPYPVGHPHDRQTQVDFDNPDFDKFPRFRNIRGQEAVVGPGDVLYIPQYWWHHIESEKNNMTVSLNFWFDPANKTDGNSTSKEDTKLNEVSGSKTETNDTEKNINNTSESNDNQSKPLNSNSTNIVIEDSSEQGDEFGSEGKTTKTNRPKRLTLEEEQSNSTERDEFVPKTLSPIEQLALLREVETKIFKATMDHSKVKEILEELLKGRFDFLDKNKTLGP